MISRKYELKQYFNISLMRFYSEVFNMIRFVELLKETINLLSFLENNNLIFDKNAEYFDKR